MTQLITILLTSIAVTGTYFAIKEFTWTYYKNTPNDEPHIDRLGTLYEHSPWYYKPLFTCITCMASIWGTFYYWVISTGLILADTGFIGDDKLASLLIFWPITCVSCAFLNTWFYKWIEE